MVGVQGQGVGGHGDADDVSYELGLDWDCRAVESDWRSNLGGFGLEGGNGRTRDNAGGGEERVMAAKDAVQQQARM